MHTQRVGHLKINVRGVEEGYAVTVHEMPTLVETFKSHNHVNLVKSADIGQAVLLHNSSNPTSSEDLDTALSALMQMEQNGELPQYIGMGVTPPMASG
jgi:TATA-binding protein-associated factor Taf7